MLRSKTMESEEAAQSIEQAAEDCRQISMILEGFKSDVSGEPLVAKL